MDPKRWLSVSLHILYLFLICADGDPVAPLRNTQVITVKCHSLSEGSWIVIVHLLWLCVCFRGTFSEMCKTDKLLMHAFGDR